MADDFWEQWALHDPLWAILSDPTKSGRRWDLADFFETGRREISLLLYQLQQLGHSPRTDCALDFGCGVGRLTQALGGTFRTVIGVDVSPTMLRLASSLNRFPERIRYVLNPSEDLSAFASETVDFVYSDIVLQHLAPDTACRYISEFVRVLRPNASMVFQLPSHKRSSDDPATTAVAMTDDAYRARLTLAGHPPDLMLPGARLDVELDLENLSTVLWDQSTVGPIRAGNHWLSPLGQMLVQDDGRAALPGAMAPRRPVRVSIPVVAPAEPGTYVCELDLVHESISWFGDRGSRTLRFSVRVGQEALDPAPSDASRISCCGEEGIAISLPDIYADLPAPAAAAPGPFPMHGVDRDVVIELLAAHGTPVFHIEKDDRGGPEWIGYRYFASKRM